CSAIHEAGTSRLAATASPGFGAGASGANIALPCTRVAVSTRLIIRGNELAAVLLWHYGVRLRTPTDGLPLPESGALARISPTMRSGRRRLDQMIVGPTQSDSLDQCGTESLPPSFGPF